MVIVKEKGQMFLLMFTGNQYPDGVISYLPIRHLDLGETDDLQNAKRAVDTLSAEIVKHMERRIREIEQDTVLPKQVRTGIVYILTKLKTMLNPRNTDTSTRLRLLNLFGINPRFERYITNDRVEQLLSLITQQASAITDYIISDMLLKIEVILNKYRYIESESTLSKEKVIASLDYIIEKIIPQYEDIDYDLFMVTVPVFTQTYSLYSSDDENVGEITIGPYIHYKGQASEIYGGYDYNDDLNVKWEVMMVRIARLLGMGNVSEDEQFWERIIKDNRYVLNNIADVELFIGRTHLDSWGSIGNEGDLLASIMNLEDVQVSKQWQEVYMLFYYSPTLVTQIQGHIPLYMILAPQDVQPNKRNQKNIYQKLASKEHINIFYKIPHYNQQLDDIVDDVLDLLVTYYNIAKDSDIKMFKEQHRNYMKTALEPIINRKQHFVIIMGQDIFKELTGKDFIIKAIEPPETSGGGYGKEKYIEETRQNYNIQIINDLPIPLYSTAGIWHKWLQKHSLVIEEENYKEPDEELITLPSIVYFERKNEKEQKKNPGTRLRL